MQTRLLVQSFGSLDELIALSSARDVPDSILFCGDGVRYPCSQDAETLRVLSTLAVRGVQLLVSKRDLEARGLSPRLGKLWDET